MHALLTTVLRILDQEIACYQEMKQLLADEAAAMSLSKRASFDAIEVKKEALVTRLQDYERRRTDLVSELTMALGMGGAMATVTQLTAALPAPQRGQLQARAQSLRALMAAVQLKNRQNRQLIGHYLDLIKGSLTLLTQGIADTSVYHKPGTRPASTGYGGSGGWVLRSTV